MQFIPGAISFVIVVGILTNGVSIVPQAQAFIIERLSRHHATWDAGVHLMIPLVNRIAKHVNLKEQIADLPSQSVITKNNVTMCIDSVIFFVITEPKFYAYGVENPVSAIENLTATTLRNIIGSMDLDTALTSRETIDTEMRSQLDVATDPRGIKINRIELKNTLPPDVIRGVTEKQMKAEREKHELVTPAQSKREFTILNAQGSKEAVILNTRAEKQTATPHVETRRERKIQETEGQAKVIHAVKETKVDGIRLVREAGADEAVLELCNLDALIRIMDSRATKIVIPSGIQNMAGLVTALKETAPATMPGDGSEEKIRETDLSASPPRRRR